jgi:hypothetical protein
MSWAKHVADALLHDNPPHPIWRGGSFYTQTVLLFRGQWEWRSQRALGGLDELDKIT